MNCAVKSIRKIKSIFQGAEDDLLIEIVAPAATFAVSLEGPPAKLNVWGMYADLVATFEDWIAVYI